MRPDPDLLLRVPLFAALSDSQRARVASWLAVEEIEAGRLLAHAGKTEYEFFVLDEGNVRVEHEGRTLASLGPGDVFGEMAFYGDGRRNADVRAESNVRVFWMFGTRFREMQAEMPEVTERLRKLVQERQAQETDA